MEEGFSVSPPREDGVGSKIRVNSSLIEKYLSQSTSGDDREDHHELHHHPVPYKSYASASSMKEKELLEMKRILGSLDTSESKRSVFTPSSSLSTSLTSTSTVPPHTYNRMGTTSSRDEISEIYEKMKKLNLPATASATSSSVSASFLKYTTPSRGGGMGGHQPHHANKGTSSFPATPQYALPSSEYMLTRPFVGGSDGGSVDHHLKHPEEGLGEDTSLGSPLVDFASKLTGHGGESTWTHTNHAPDMFYEPPSTTSGGDINNTAPQNSKAVLSALRTLQDKIRKLEGERMHFSEQCQELTQQIKMHRKQEEEQSSLAVSHYAKQEAEHKKEVVLLMNEKNHLHMESIKNAETLKSQAKEIQMLREHLQTSEFEKRVSMEKEAQLENRIKELEADLALGREREVKLEKAIQNVDQATKEIAGSSVKVKDELEIRLKKERAIRIKEEKKRKNTEAFLRNVIEINENLVEKVTTPGRIKINSTKEKNQVKPKLKKKKATVPTSLAYDSNLGSLLNTFKPTEVRRPITSSRAPYSTSFNRDADDNQVRGAGISKKVVMTKEEEAPITVENEDEVVNVLASLRQEYKDLNDRYKALLAEARKNANTKKDAIDEAKLSAAMKRMIEQIERKGNQIVSALKHCLLREIPLLITVSVIYTLVDEQHEQSLLTRFDQTMKEKKDSKIKGKVKIMKAKSVINDLSALSR